MSDARRILIVEDEPGLQMTLEDRLCAEGYEVETAGDGFGAERAAAGGQFDLILLDVMLPGQDGFQVCRRLRRKGIRTPILMLTARGEVDDRVRGLELGADDYLLKPFEMRELLARVEALLRRIPGGRRLVTFGAAKVDFAATSATLHGEPVEMSARMFRLLEYLVEHAGETLTREQLLQEVWGYSSTPSTRTVDVHIAWLRRALEETPDAPRHIVTVRGLGYRFDP